MKPYLFKHPEAAQSAFFILNDKGQHFYDTLHYHPIYQFTIIKQGEGTFFVGDHIERFKPGDIFLLAPDIPHVLRSDSKYYKENTDLVSESVAAYFRYDSFGDAFFNLPENINIKNLLQRSERGVKVSGQAAANVAQEMYSLPKLKGVRKLATLLLCLEHIATAPKDDVTQLASIGFVGSAKNNEGDRMDKVFDYIMDHLTEGVTLDKVSEVACMTSNAFCRFFKKRTQKSLIQFVNEARVGHAARLLLEERYSTSQAASMSGFNNISHFNRQFKTINGMTPSEYLNIYKHSGALETASA